jgi:hypothetical protein
LIYKWIKREFRTRSGSWRQSNASDNLQIHVSNNTVLLPVVVTCSQCFGSETIFFRILILFSSEFWIRIRSRLDLQKVPDPILNIHPFTMLTI